MRHSIWYRTEEKNPDKSGYYLSYRGWGMAGKGDGDHDHGFLWYDKKRDEWRDYETLSIGDGAIVYYWTDANPDNWTNEDPPSIKIRQGMKQEHVAVQEAWADVEEAIKRYETVRILCDKSNI
jgi:hypothetical protein